MVKKIFCLSLIFLFCLFIFGCSQGKNTSSTTGGLLGRVLLDGTSDYSSILVTIEGSISSTTTSSDGYYSLSNIPEGVVTLNFTKSGYSNQSKSVAVSADQITNVSTITLFKTTSTTTTTPSPSTTTTTSSVASSTTTTTTTTTYKPFTIEEEHNMSSLLSGTILAMTSTGNSLYISTTERLYRISINTPTTVTNSVAVTNNFVSMSAIDKYSQINCMAQLGNDMISYSYDYSLNLTNTDIDADLSPPPAITRYDPSSNDKCVYYYNGAFYARNDTTGYSEKIQDTSVTGIVSLDTHDEINYFACNSTNIYKFNSDFSSYSTLGGGTDLVGIAHDGTNIWLIDATTKKLYKCTDSW